MQKNTLTLPKVWRGVKLFFKWLWLITLFLFGLALYLFLVPLGMFEYAFSLSELDIIETSFIVFLVMFFYRYIQLCRRSDAPLVRKIITPWVHQAYLGLFSIGLVVIAIKFFAYNLEQPVEPLVEIIEYLCSVAVFGYSYYRVSQLSNQQVSTTPVANTQGAEQ
ncbi:hypothetical protein [Vibrio sp. 1151_11]|uniref:hypothetical protein n=1 Tax=Vibrio sp. 1151_11 TaxID=2527670 RepID=UPI0024050818|nr:hypothetical protein [Vibrio sp. 1151_11]